MLYEFILSLFNKLTMERENKMCGSHIVFLVRRCNFHLRWSLLYCSKSWTLHQSSWVCYHQISSKKLSSSSRCFDECRYKLVMNRAWWRTREQGATVLINRDQLFLFVHLLSNSRKGLNFDKINSGCILIFWEIP